MRSCTSEPSPTAGDIAGFPPMLSQHLIFRWPRRAFPARKAASRSRSTPPARAFQPHRCGMISEKQTPRPIESSGQRLGRVVLTELPSWQLLVLATAAGALWAASLFDWSFVAGGHAFWQFPEGTIGGGRNDMALYLAAYLYYVQSQWQLPLFYVSE